MNTQNVNVKTATKESSERWGSDPKARLACVIAEQKSYLAELCDVCNLQLSQHDEAEEILRLLSLMSGNVHKEGVLCWERSYPSEGGKRSRHYQSGEGPGAAAYRLRLGCHRVRCSGGQQ